MCSELIFGKQFFSIEKSVKNFSEWIWIKWIAISEVYVGVNIRPNMLKNISSSKFEFRLMKCNLIFSIMVLHFDEFLASLYQHINMILLDFHKYILYNFEYYNATPK